MQSTQSTPTHQPSQEFSSSSRFRENLSVYIPPPNFPIMSSRFSPESPPPEPESRTQSIWTSSATMRSSSSIRKDVHAFQVTEPLPTASSRKSRFSKLWFDMRTFVMHNTRNEPESAMLEEPALPAWPPLNIEKRRCSHDCPCHALVQKNKKQRRNKILVYVLVIIIIYLLGSTTALNVRVFSASAPPSTTNTQNTASTNSALSPDAQQCLSQYVVNAPSNPSQYPCSTCLSVLRSIPSSFFSLDESDGQQITNAIQFCGLRAVFESADGDGQSALKNGDWAQDVRFCAWAGVQCDGTGRVSSLSLTFPGIPSSIPNELTALEGLQSLTVIGNSAVPAGSLPSNLSSWGSMSTFHLESTAMTSLPDGFFASLKQLTTLTLVKNTQMGESLPSSITQSSLQNLIVNGQILTNPLSTLSSSESLQGSLKLLDLSETSINGVIPSTIASFTSMTELHLDGNSLSTPLPLSFPPSLQTLSLFNNAGLIGPVQDSFCTLGNLQSCNIQNTGLSAPNGCGVCQFSSPVITN